MAAPPTARRQLGVALLRDLYVAVYRRSPTKPGRRVKAIRALTFLKFLNSGNAKLDRGARAWAARHGYTVTTQPGPGPSPTWGTANQEL